MNLVELWKRASGSVCSIVLRDAAGEVVGSGTGFRVGKWVVTNRHVIPKPSDLKVAITFVCDDGRTPSTVPLYMSARQLDQCVRAGDDESRWDYVLLDFDDDPFRTVPSLELADEVPPVGSRVALLGFHFDQEHLAIHGGIIASRFVQKDTGVKYVQLDASVNNGNSGGPLLDLDSGRVIGIVTRKLTGLTRQFAGLIEAFDMNMSILENSGGGGFAMGLAGGRQFQLFPAIIAMQEQMKRIAREIERSANVGIGFAYEMEKIRETMQRFEA